MKENCHYGTWKNRLPFHTMPSRQHKSNKIAYKVNLPAFFTLDTISCFILNRDVEAEAVNFLWKRKYTLMKQVGSESELGSESFEKEPEAEAKIFNGKEAEANSEA